MASELNIPATYLNSVFGSREVKAIQQYAKAAQSLPTPVDADLQAQITALAARVTALEQAP